MSYTPAEDDVIADRYRLVEYMDEGGVSKVWEAVDEETGDKVAVKHPNYDSTNDPAVLRDSLASELEILEAIRDAGGHPNVMALRDSVTDHGMQFIVVDFVEGEDMLQVVKRRNGITDPGDVRKIGVALCEAMSFLHRNEVIYRDLKPDNVMLRSDFEPVLIDFNTAKGFEADDEGMVPGGTVIPNPVYKPPELNNDPELVGYRQGPWSDVYSIGKVLMYMISGSGVRKDAVDPRDFPGTRSVTPYLAEIIERATQKHKDDRYRNATVLARVLQNRDPDPPEVAHLEHVQTGRTYELFPGDTIGRQAADGPQPSIALEDPENYISAVQAQVEFADGAWTLVDRSLNGTWLQRDGDWTQVLSERGRERLAERDEDPEGPDAEPPERVALEPGDRVALVHPRYGVWLEFEG